MPDWLIERGIGETRLVRIENDEIVEARVHLEGIAKAGTVRQVVLKTIGPPAIASDGTTEFVLPNGARGITEGSTFAIEVTREPIPGAEPWKRPLGKVSDGIAVPMLEGEVQAFPSPDDVLEDAGWSDLLEEARSGIVRFFGGELRVSSTPAMTLIDVDGRLATYELALAGARAAARTILRHGIGGSIGIDLPTVAGKAQRQAIGEAVDAILLQPFERTAVNGFGFLQIVRPRRHASLFELAADRAPFEARALLRHAAMERTGATALVAHPAIIRVLEDKPDWLEQLARQVGGAVRLQADAKLPMSGAYAQSD